MLPFQSHYGFQNSWLSYCNGGVKESVNGGYSIINAAESSKEERKSTEASRSHKEAERRRRQRINSHLSTLRTLLPNTTKTDKASLLAEVVNHLKELRKRATEMARRDTDLCSSSSIRSEVEPVPWPFPSEDDEATLCYCDNEKKLMRATVCCDDRSSLNRDLTQAIQSVHAKLVRAEIMTVGGRTKNVMVLEWTGGATGSGGTEEEFAGLRRALKAVVENQAQNLSGLRTCWGRLVSEMAALGPTLVHKNPFLFSSFSVLRRSPLSMGEEIDETHLEVPSNHELEVSTNSSGLAQEHTGLEVKNVAKVKDDESLFDEIKQRFLSFKKHKYLENLERFQALAEVQAPKFMVISCADSRVCPSNILGFQPGEAFMIRNVANIVPPLENGPTETNAALEFAINTLEVENILVIGHSSCAGIQNLMSMEDDAINSSFAHKWIVNAKVAKLRTKAAAAHLSFDQQCKYCEKESINRSLKNLLTYPWIEERAKRELLSIHGGYYDFLTCTFEKWTLDYKNSSRIDNHDCLVKNQSFWS